MVVELFDQWAIYVHLVCNRLTIDFQQVSGVGVGGHGGRLSLDVGTLSNYRELNLLSSQKEFINNIYIKVRSTGKLLKAKVILKNKEASVEILDEETGVSPGQACVFYSKDSFGDKVLGGGWIHNTENKKLST